MEIFDALLQQSLDKTVSFMVAVVGGMFVLGIIITPLLFSICKRLRIADMNKRDYETLKKKQRSLILSLSIIVIALVVIPFASIQKIPTLKNDIEHQQYIRAEVEYTHNRNGKGEHSVSIVSGEETIYLELPEGWSEDEFPRGTFFGTAWYSKDSKILLSFTPDDAE